MKIFQLTLVVCLIVHVSNMEQICTIGLTNVSIIAATVYIVNIILFNCLKI